MSKNKTAAYDTMEIALVNPPNQKSYETHGVPLNLGYLAAYVEKYGYTAKIFDFENYDESPASLVSLYSLHRFPFVGITTYTQTMKRAAGLAREIKEKNPRCIIAVGGYHASALAEETLESFPWIDVVVKKDGEVPLLYLLEAMKKKSGFDHIPNIVYRTSTAVKNNETLSWEKDISDFPFPKRKVENYNYHHLPWIAGDSKIEKKNILHLISSIGCPYQCNYCAISKYNEGKVRFRRVDSIIAEIKENLSKFSFQHIYFQDPNFFLQPKRAVEIGKLLHHNFPLLSFSFETRADQILSAKSYLVQLRELGCNAINIGVESANERFLKRMNKRITAAENAMAIRFLEKIGIKPQVYMIMFDAECTPMELKTNLLFLKETGLYGALPHESLLYCRLQPLPGTVYWITYRQKYGIPDIHEPAPALFDDTFVLFTWNVVREFRATYSTGIFKAITLINNVFKEGVFERPQYSPKALQYLQLSRVTLQFTPFQLLEECVDLACNSSGEEYFREVFQKFSRKTERILELTDRIIENGSGPTF